MRKRHQDNDPVAAPPRMETVRICPEPFMRPTVSYEVTFQGARKRTIDADEFTTGNGLITFYRLSRKQYPRGDYRSVIVFAVPQERVGSVELIEGEELYTPECYEREVPRRNG